MGAPTVLLSLDIMAYMVTDVGQWLSVGEGLGGTDTVRYITGLYDTDRPV